MAVKLNVQANVTGQGQLTKLNTGLKSLGTQALIAKRKLAALEAGAARAKATMAGLGTALKVGVVAGFAAAGFAAVSFVKSTFKAGNMMESAQIQFKAFFGSAEAGAEAFKLLNEYASTVPFSIDEIIQGSTALAAISDGPEDLGKQLQIVGNLAAAANLSFSDAALQYQKVASAGIAAADLLRDRGVKALLGFTEGVRYTAEESIAVFEKNYSKNGRFGKVADELAGTLKGSASMVQDFYFQLNAAAAKPLFEGLTKQINELVGDFKKNDAELKRLAERIGESLAVGFGNLGKFIKFVVDNFDKLVKGIKLFLALKIFGFVNNVGGAFLLWAAKIKTVRRAFIALNLTMKANPIGLIVLAIEALVLGFIIFEDKIKNIVSGALKNFNENLKHIQINFLKFKNLLNIGDEDVNLSAIQTLEGEIRNLSNRWDEAAEAKFAYLNGSGNRFDGYDDQIAKRKNYQGANPRMDMRRTEIAAEEKIAKVKDFMTEQSAKRKINSYKQIQNFDKTVREAEAKWKAEANQRALEAMTAQRAQLALIGIESQAIATTIGDTWVNGLREGNSLLQITKDSFKNVLQMIAETILRKTIEYGVELLFQALLGKKVDKEKEITKEKKKQFFWTALTAGMGGGGGNGGSFLGMAEGGVVPGGAPYTDRIPTMLTPGEVVIPRNKVGQQSSVTNNTINISGNVDQRAIDQIRSVISSSPSHVGGANKNYTRNTSGLRNRGK